MQRLHSFRGGGRNDDETLLVLQREEESFPMMLGAVASSSIRPTLEKFEKSQLKANLSVSRTQATSCPLGSLTSSDETVNSLFPLWFPFSLSRRDFDFAK